MYVPQEDVLDRLHFLVHALHGESLVIILLALVAAGRGRPVPAVGGGAVAVLHGRESVESPRGDVEDAHGDHAAPGEDSQGSLVTLFGEKRTSNVEFEIFSDFFDRELSGETERRKGGGREVSKF